MDALSTRAPIKAEKCTDRTSEQDDHHADQQTSSTSPSHQQKEDRGKGGVRWRMLIVLMVLTSILFTYIGSTFTYCLFLNSANAKLAQENKQLAADIRQLEKHNADLLCEKKQLPAEVKWLNTTVSSEQENTVYTRNLLAYCRNDFRQCRHTLQEFLKSTGYALCKIQPSKQETASWQAGLHVARVQMMRRQTGWKQRIRILLDKNRRSNRALHGSQRKHYHLKMQMENCSAATSRLEKMAERLRYDMSNNDRTTSKFITANQRLAEQYCLLQSHAATQRMSTLTPCLDMSHQYALKLAAAEVLVARMIGLISDGSARNSARELRLLLGETRLGIVKALRASEYKFPQKTKATVTAEEVLIVDTTVRKFSTSFLEFLESLFRDAWLPLDTGEPAGSSDFTMQQPALSDTTVMMVTLAGTIIVLCLVGVYHIFSERGHPPEDPDAGGSTLNLPPDCAAPSLVYPDINIIQLVSFPETNSPHLDVISVYCSFMIIIIIIIESYTYLNK